MLSVNLLALPLMTRFEVVSVTLFVKGVVRLPPSNQTMPVVRLITRVVELAGGV
jgi:hypothetical protein